MSPVSLVALLVLGGAQDQPMDYGQAQAFVRAGETEPLGLASPIAVIAFEHDMLLRYSVISFHISWRPDETSERRPFWFARLRSTHHTNVQVSYADGRTCLALNDVLLAMEQLSAPLLDLPWVPSESPLTELNGAEPMHDFKFSLSAPGHFPGSMTAAKVTVSGGSLSPVGVWMRESEAKLADCWNADPPAWVVEDEQTRARHAAQRATGLH